MNIFQGIVLGIVQGLTEFLPISSSGHLVFFENLFGLGDNLFITVALHLGTLVAVFICFSKEIKYILKHPFSKLSIMLVVATIPTVIIILAFKTYIEDCFSGNFYLIGFSITAILLTFTEIIAKKKTSNNEINYKTAIIMGIMQGIAGLPGVSRSGSTICGGLLCGKDKEQVAKFSFLLSIPIIIASLVYEILFNTCVAPINVAPLLIGLLFSVISGILAIKIMIKLVSNANFTYFSVYLTLLVIIITVSNL